MAPATAPLTFFLLALGLAAVASTASGAGRALRGGRDRRKLEPPKLGNPLDCILRGKLDVGEFLGKGEGVCAGNTELESHEFGLTPGGQIIVWHHDYRTDVETVVWRDPSGAVGDALTLKEDGTVVLYDGEGAPLCALGEPSPGLQNPKLVVSPQGEVSVKAATSGTTLWTLDAEASVCQ
jgi:hypothetical protein